ncbi:MAG: nitrile hydratase [Pseudonocardia sp. SCN 72-51]|nr:MAG: nitrile hydratase [Pseudonocardia sp. SCN 72-51]
MLDADARAQRLDLSARLMSRFAENPDAPYPDQLSQDQLTAYLKTSHDVGGEPDVPFEYQLKEYEHWEHNTYVLCEVLAWRGIWVSEERRRIQNVDFGRTIYLGLPYYGRWLLSTARILVDKHYVTLGELFEKMADVNERSANLRPGEHLDVMPRCIGDESVVPRNHHHTAARGKGDPQVFEGCGGVAKFKEGDQVRVRDIPALFYTRTQEYIRGAVGTIAKVSYESLAPEDEAWDRHDQPAEWFYIVRFNQAELWANYAGPDIDTLQTEIPERWLASA